MSQNIYDNEEFFYAVHLTSARNKLQRFIGTACHEKAAS